MRVDSETTETTSVSVQPDGTLQYEADTLPVRTQRGGAWADLDETLSTDGSGMLAPKVPSVPVRFSPGGSNVLDQVQAPNGEWITETWPFGNLPAPAVADDTVTYKDALPGVDVKLTATVSGMSSLLVINTPDAAADPRLASFRLGERGATVQAATADTMVASTGIGSSLTAGSPLWWDSSEGGNSEGPGGNEPNRPVAHVVDSTGMTLNVVDTVSSVVPTYPVYIDPDWNSGITSSWYTDKAYPSQSYLTAAESDVLRVGIYAQWESHMFFQFPLPSSLAGAEIQDASLDMTQLSLDACPANSITLERYGPQTAGFTWNGESGSWHGSLGSKNPGTCADVSANVAVGWDVQSAVASMIGKTSIQFGLKSTTSAQSRRHFSRAAKLIIKFDHAPDDPTSPTFELPTRTCATTSAGAVSFNSNQDVKFSVNQSDSDAGNVADDFYVNDVTTGTQLIKHTTALQAKGTIDWLYSGPTFVNGHMYAWRAQGSDYTLTSAKLTPWCYFKIDNTPPTAPTMSSTAATAVGVGVTVQLGQGASTDVAGYEYWLDASGATTASAPVTVSKTAALPANGYRSGAAAFAAVSTSSVTVAPTDDTSSMWAVTYDGAGNMSTPVSVPLVKADGTPVGIAGTGAMHSWKLSAMTSPLPSTIADGAGSLNLSVGSGIPLDTTDTVAGVPDVPLLTFGGSVTTATSVTAGGSAINTLQSFSASAYVKPASSSGTQTILAQSGTSRSGFVLESIAGKMTFCIQPQTGSTTDCVASSTASPVGTWTLVTGIWDAVNHQLRLVINGNSAKPAVALHSIPSGDTTAAGPVTVGSAQVAGALANAWNGSITNPRIEQQVLEHTQLYSMENLY